MSAARLVLDEELARLSVRRGPGSAEAYALLELREARSKGENVFAFRDLEGRYAIGPMELLTADLVRSQRSRQAF